MVHRLSKHFRKRWRERMADKLTVNAVNRIIRDGKQIERCGRRAVILNGAVGVIVVVDCQRGMAVTVFRVRTVRP